MAKNHRGTGIRSLPSHGRGTCPVCHKTGVKIIYEVEIDGNKVMVCKFCNAAMKNKARKEKRAQKAAVSVAEPAATEAPVQESATE
ncbi:MAG: hypothetical protein J6I73_01935 [Treponema sp.]|nr:hypothetical protein [Treponema sp.]